MVSSWWRGEGSSGESGARRTGAELACVSLQVPMEVPRAPFYWVSLLLPQPQNKPHPSLYHPRHCPWPAKPTSPSYGRGGVFILFSVTMSEVHITHDALEQGWVDGMRPNHNSVRELHGVPTALPFDLYFTTRFCILRCDGPQHELLPSPEASDYVTWTNSLFFLSISARTNAHTHICIEQGIARLNLEKSINQSVNKSGVWLLCPILEKFKSQSIKPRIVLVVAALQTWIHTGVTGTSYYNADSDATGLGWGLRFISYKLLGHVDAAGSGLHSRMLCFPLKPALS